MDNYARHGISIFSAVLLHLVILLIYFDTPIPHQNTHSYSIEVTSSPISNSTLDSISQDKKRDRREDMYDKPINDIKESTTHETVQKRENNEDLHPEKKDIITPEERVIDSRSMYDVEYNQHKQTAVQLDMTGWEWDSVPNPKDNTEEIGKIVFQIIIDSDGFVIGIKEIEKTVSPQLVSLYKEALAKISFSKSSDSTIDSTTTKGTVTFIINAK
jgi:hypothetical protein